MEPATTRAHARRKFDEAVKSLPQKEQAGCAALEGQAFCTKLFSLEKTSKTFPLKRSANSGRAGQSRCWTLCSYGRKKNRR